MVPGKASAPGLEEIEWPRDLWRFPGIGTSLPAAASPGVLVASMVTWVTRVARTGLILPIFGHTAYASILSLHGSSAFACDF